MSRLGINTEHLRSRREALGLSQRALARAIGETESSVRGIERNPGGHGELTLSLLGRLAEALDVAVEFLLSQEDTHEAASDEDITRLIAVLLDGARVPTTNPADIAVTLDWSLQRTRTAISAARPALEPLGVSVWRRPGRGITLRPTANGITDSERQRLARAVTRRRGTSITHLRLLARVMLDDAPQDWERTTDENIRMHLAALRNRGLVEATAEGRHSLTHEAAFCLLLTEEPPA